MPDNKQIAELLNEIENLLADINNDLRSSIIPNFKYNHGDDQYIEQYINAMKRLPNEEN